MVTVTKLDRAFRSAKHCYDDLEYLDAHNVGFVAVTQPVDTTSAAGRLILGVLAAVAVFQRLLISERTKEGLARTKSHGVRLGRPPGIKDRQKRRTAGYRARWAK